MAIKKWYDRIGETDDTNVIEVAMLDEIGDLRRVYAAARAVVMASTPQSETTALLALKQLVLLVYGHE